MVACVANGCGSHTSKRIPGITFHRFPKDRKQFIRWLHNIGREDWIPSLHSRICSKHFEPSCFYKTSQKVLLLHGAVPTIFPETETYLKEEHEILTDSDGEEASKLDPKKKILGKKLKRKIKRRKMESHERKDLSNGNIDSRQSPKEELEFTTVIDDSTGTSSDENEQPHESSNSPHDKDEKEPNTTVDISDDSESSQWSLSELSLVKNIKTSVLPHNSENKISSSAECDDQNMLSSSASDTGDNEDSLDESVGEMVSKYLRDDYSSDDMRIKVRAKMDYKKSKKTIVDLRRKVRNLQKKNRALTKKVQCLKSLFCYLEKNNFLNQFAGAAIKAVMSGRAEPP